MSPQLNSIVAVLNHNSVEFVRIEVHHILGLAPRLRGVGTFALVFDEDAERDNSG